jgi:hypothetical protein
MRGKNLRFIGMYTWDSEDGSLFWTGVEEMMTGGQHEGGQKRLYLTASALSSMLQRSAITICGG